MDKRTVASAHTRIDNLEKEYKTEIERFNDDLTGVLKTGFDMNKEEIYDFLSKNELDAYDFAVKELKSVFASHGPTSLLRRFNDEFKKDSDGKMRNWKEVEEGLILEVYKASQVKIDALLNDCKNLFFPSNIT